MIRIKKTEDSEEIVQRKETAKYNLELDHPEEYERYELENEEIFLSKETQIEGDFEDLVNTDTDTDRSETNEIDQRKNHDLHRTLNSLRI